MTVAVNPMDLVCPMHARLGADGRLLHAGPTLRKLFEDQAYEGRGFLDLFEVTRPKGVRSIRALRDLTGQKLHLRLRHAADTGLKAICIPDPGGEGLFINLSFGISVLDAVRDYDLTNTDFAPTDLTIEMLYLMEAKSVAMDASRRLNQRLDLAKTTAETEALTDPLTGIQNRRGMEQFVIRAIERQAEFALMHVDLDQFKQINDTQGHAVGDKVLQEAARIMRQETRHRDAVARIGGDEFVLVIDDAPTVATVEQISQRILTRFRAPIMYGDQACYVTCSIGSVFSHDYARPEVAQMMSDADQALYASKNKGRACHTIFSPSEQRVGEAGSASSP